MQYTHQNPLVQGFYATANNPDDVARPDQIPENIFTLEEIEQLVLWWAYVGFPAGDRPLLVPVQPGYLIAGSKGDGQATDYLQRLPLAEDPQNPQVGYWRPMPGAPNKPLWATRLRRTNNGVPLRDSTHYRGNRNDARYRRICGVMTGVYDRWRARQALPSSDSNHISIEFPLDGTPNRGLFNIGRVLIRYNWGIAFPARQFDVSHLAAAAEQNDERFPGGRYAVIGMACLEYGLFNNSRIPCNIFGLWHKDPVSMAILSDEQLLDPNRRVACWHGSTRFPCYGPSALAGEIDYVGAEPTGFSPGRGAGKKGKGGARRLPEGGPSTSQAKKGKTTGDAKQSGISKFFKACVSAPAVDELGDAGDVDEEFSWEERETAEHASAATIALVERIETWSALKASAPSGPVG